MPIYAFLTIPIRISVIHYDNQLLVRQYLAGHPNLCMLFYPCVLGIRYLCLRMLLSRINVQNYITLQHHSEEYPAQWMA